MTYLLDTCILSKLRKLFKYPDPQLQNWIQQHSANLYCISVFSIAEIQAGISKLENKTVEKRKLKADLEDWLFNDLVPDFEGRILEFDLKLAHCWGQLVGECKKKGINLPIMDSLIAATSLMHGLTLVTENEIDFVHTGVTIINPWG